jgi:uncharacterized DUF497 family protein
VINDAVEWDDAKAADNLAKHGIAFELAIKAFKDPFGIEYLDERQDYGEERLILIAMAEGSLLFVAYTEREDRVRLISARRATKYEHDEYYRQNG